MQRSFAVRSYPVQAYQLQPRQSVPRLQNSPQMWRSKSRPVSEQLRRQTTVQPPPAPRKLERTEAINVAVIDPVY